MSDTNGRRAGRGRSVLFSAPTTDEVNAAAVAGEGREALFSAPPRRRGTIVVECSRCEARTPVPAIELGIRLIPSIWLPFREFSRFTRCPACGQAAWCRVHWRTVLDGGSAS